MLAVTCFSVTSANYILCFSEVCQYSLADTIIRKGLLSDFSLLKEFKNVIKLLYFKISCDTGLHSFHTSSNFAKFLTNGTL